MPSLDLSFLQELQEDYTKYPCFVETGTYLGATVLGLEPFFKKLYTIELSEKYHALAKANYTGSKIQFILGESATIFEALLPSLDEPSIIFLDAHWSGDDTASAAKNVPLKEELSQIRSLFQKEALLIIDDCRLFGSTYGNTWHEINQPELIALLGPRVTKVYSLDSECAKNDRLIIHLKANEA